ncbi:PA14 domain protein [Novipirellula aureliae]|uniref:PA14 domain protein n=1 Tax=Novipirellula aureliae TaxID=2527966 RepID=A0A5C6DIP4_9BACT|nr:DUF1588 domain-containing protein [Novipirellula aureliae]TWU36680.1 PA14 domain protein [Novipirellula aureliae]
MPFTTKIVVAIFFAFPTVAPLSTVAMAEDMPHTLAEHDNGGGENTGAAIYSSQCASCHGPNGQGTADNYPSPLVGDSSIGELSEIIAETMPEDDPDTCKDKDAEDVARYIHESFYSEAARQRQRTPTITLARLTGDQLRQSLADLYASQSGSAWLHQQHGVTGNYFDGPRWKKENLRIERVDPTIDFDFALGGPGEGIQPEEFYIQWIGTLKVDRSGEYEIVLRTTCSSMLTFGDRQRVLIDNHVQSEGRTEFKRRIRLDAGRGYPFELTLIQRKRKTGQTPASISLSWTPPGGAEEIIPTRNLLAARFPSAFSLQQNLPPDDHSYGYERGTQISRSWDDSVTQAAIEFSHYAEAELWPRYQQKHKKDSNQDRETLMGFLSDLVKTAFRGSLDDATRKQYIDKQVAATKDDAEAIRRVCLLALKSPRFLYPLLDTSESVSQRVANRLALVLHDSLPVDDWLCKQVERDQLVSEKQISNAAWQMVNDYRTRGKTRAFLAHWFHVDNEDELVKDGELYPGFDRELVGDLRASFDAFVEDVVWSDASDFRQFFQSDYGYTTDRIFEFYGEIWKPADPRSSLTRSVSDPSLRHGLLNHPLLMSQLSYFKTTSPIHRGVFLNRYLLGRTLRPPNQAFTPLNPDLHPGLTTRERVTLQTNDVNCQVCHQRINGLGFALENYDAVGRLREMENGHAIDASGFYVTSGEETVEFIGASELADFLVRSDDCHRAFVEAAFEHFVKQPIAAYGPDTLDRLTKQFQKTQFSVRDLIVSIAIVASQPKDGEV